MENKLEDLIRRKIRTATYLDMYAEDDYDIAELLDYLWSIVGLQEEYINALKKERTDKINAEYQSNMQFLADLFNQHKDCDAIVDNITKVVINMGNNGGK